MRTLPTVIAAGLLATVVSGQGVKAETFTLDNGLDVILHVDHSLPTVCVNIWYKVGSKDEVAGRSGFAHLFEHLMFMGTTRVPGSGFDDLMETGGGANNASTSSDRTNYFSWGPANLLPTLLWLEADRMQDFGKSMTQAKLDKQREVVRNERRQTVEMRPYGRSEEQQGTLFYPPSHPYHSSVIGSHRDLEAATLQDVKDFFATYYVPNNASLVVAGDFDPEQVKPLIKKWFATLPRGAEVPRRKAEPFQIEKPRRRTFFDRVQFPKLTLVYASPRFFGEGDAAMDLAAAVLGSGKSSRLYKRLVYADKVAVSVEVYQWSRLLGGEFHIEVMARPDVPLADIEKKIDEEIDRLIEDGITQHELDKHRTKILYGATTRLESLRARADQLNSYNFFLGKPDGFAFDRKRYEALTRDTVQAWSKRVLTKSRLAANVYPEPSAGAVDPRDERPVLSARTEFTAQQPITFKLENGISVQYWNRPELPLVSAAISFSEGAMADPADKAGLTRLMAGMLDEGAGERGALEFSDALSQLGATLGASADRDAMQVSVQSLASRFDEAIALFSDAVLRPRFDPAEWQRVRRLHVQGLKRAKDNPSQVAREVASTVFFGTAHPYGRPVAGTVASCSKLTLDDLKDAYRRIVHPAKAKIWIAGDLSRDRARALLDRSFGSWRIDAKPRVSRVAVTTPADPFRVFIVDKPKAVQTVIRFMMPGPKYANPDRPVYNAINTVLGGSFTSRLNQNIREKHGFAYGAGSAIVMWPRIGAAVASSSVQARHTGAALREFLNEFKRLRSGDVTEDEARKARATNLQTVVSGLEGLGGLIQTAIRLDVGGQRFSALRDEISGIQSVTARRMNQLAERALPLEHAVLILVGNKKLILDQIAPLGLPRPVEVDANGKRVAGN